jgi:hypothetical protein
VSPLGRAMSSPSWPTTTPCRPLVDQVRTIGEGEVWLEPAPYRSASPRRGGGGPVHVERRGVLVAALFDMVIDGRTLTWEEFGAALGAMRGGTSGS